MGMFIVVWLVCLPQFSQADDQDRLPRADWVTVDLEQLERVTVDLEQLEPPLVSSIRQQDATTAASARQLPIAEDAARDAGFEVASLGSDEEAVILNMSSS
ncbi:hypothetical protein T492DRAFT_962772 [Pavlovales sp. CCMP2436]|nr:hypothetical protein T492DRAFT_962772 [Pavlovales sp. CCMP2436]